MVKALAQGDIDGGTGVDSIPKTILKNQKHKGSAL